MPKLAMLTSTKGIHCSMQFAAEYSQKNKQTCKKYWSAWHDYYSLLPSWVTTALWKPPHVICIGRLPNRDSTRRGEWEFRSAPWPNLPNLPWIIKRNICQIIVYQIISFKHACTWCIESSYLAPSIHLSIRVSAQNNKMIHTMRSITKNSFFGTVHNKARGHTRTSPISVKQPVWNPQALICTTCFPLNLSSNFGVYWCPSVSPCPATPFSLSPHLCVFRTWIWAYEQLWNWYTSWWKLVIISLVCK